MILSPTNAGLGNTEVVQPLVFVVIGVFDGEDRVDHLPGNLVYGDHFAVLGKETRHFRSVLVKHDRGQCRTIVVNRLQFWEIEAEVEIGSGSEKDPCRCECQQGKECRPGFLSPPLPASGNAANLQILLLVPMKPG